MNVQAFATKFRKKLKVKLVPLRIKYRPAKKKKKIIYKTIYDDDFFNGNWRSTDLRNLILIRCSSIKRFHYFRKQKGLWEKEDIPVFVPLHLDYASILTKLQCFTSRSQALKDNRKTMPADWVTTTIGKKNLAQTLWITFWSPPETISIKLWDRIKKELPYIISDLKSDIPNYYTPKLMNFLKSIANWFKSFFSTEEICNNQQCENTDCNVHYQDDVTPTETPTPTPEPIKETPAEPTKETTPTPEPIKDEQISPIGFNTEHITQTPDVPVETTTEAPTEAPKVAPEAPIEPSAAPEPAPATPVATKPVVEAPTPSEAPAAATTPTTHNPSDKIVKSETHPFIVALYGAEKHDKKEALDANPAFNEHVKFSCNDRLEKAVTYFSKGKNNWEVIVNANPEDKNSAPVPVSVFFLDEVGMELLSKNKIADKYTKVTAMLECGNEVTTFVYTPEQVKVRDYKYNSEWALKK